MVQSLTMHRECIDSRSEEDKDEGTKMTKNGNDGKWIETMGLGLTCKCVT
jgi:hypothetical protein